jgi:hypothetical protein
VIQDVVQDLPLLPSPKVSSQSERQTKRCERERERESFWLAVWFLKDLPPNAVLELRISSTIIIIIILQQQQLHCIPLCLFVVIGIVDFFGFS